MGFRSKDGYHTKVQHSGFCFTVLTSRRVKQLKTEHLFHEATHFSSEQNYWNELIGNFPGLHLQPFSVSCFWCFPPSAPSSEGETQALLQTRPKDSPGATPDSSTASDPQPLTHPHSDLEVKIKLSGAFILKVVLFSYKGGNKRDHASPSHDMTFTVLHSHELVCFGS